MSVWDILIRIALAVLIGGLIGYERENKNRPAGFRTHILVCLGAAVISMIQIYNVEFIRDIIKEDNIYTGAVKSDIGRLAAQVVSGIGFLGAGTIIHEKGSVKGLTTAASLWSVACIGLAVGFGYYPLAILSSITVVIVLVSMKRVEDSFREKSVVVQFRVDYINYDKAGHEVANYFRERNIKVNNIEFITNNESEGIDQSFCGIYTVVMPRSMNKKAIVEDLRENVGIGDIKII